MASARRSSQLLLPSLVLLFLAAAKLRSVNFVAQLDRLELEASPTRHVKSAHSGEAKWTQSESTLPTNSPRPKHDDDDDDDDDDDGEQFVWSDLIQDWTLRRPGTEAGASTGEGSARAQALEQRPRAKRRRAQQQQQQRQQQRLGRRHRIWPPGDRPIWRGDRIVDQLRLKPRVGGDQLGDQLGEINVALAGDSAAGEGARAFSGCNFNQCQITRNLYKADAIVFPNSDVAALKAWPELAAASGRRSQQIWIAYLLESPPNTFDGRFLRPTRDKHPFKFNWTAAYRSDADIVTPYSKFVPYEDTLGQFLALRQAGRRSSSAAREVDTAAAAAADGLSGGSSLIGGRKQGKVAWLVSNCHARNDRLEYARQLAQHIQVDIFGRCGNRTCAKSSTGECLKFLNQHYKFYLSFENSNNREYITEKLYRNALGYNEREHALLPVVMGPGRGDYERLAPPHSFLHVNDFASPKELAERLQELHSNEAAYLSYFKWKTLGRFIDTKFLCRLCALLHKTRSKTKQYQHQQQQQQPFKSYDNLRDWWLNEPI